MINIAFYISNHGFGHASRNIPIIKELSHYKEVKLFVKSGKEQIEFIKQSLKDNLSKIALFRDELDIGLVCKNDSFGVDKGMLENKLIRYIDFWDIMIEKEKVFLKENNINLVVSDIVPWVFKAAKGVKIKSLFISNFTWAEIYSNYFESYIYDKYLECYRIADKAFLYELHNEKIRKYFSDFDFVGFSVRQYDQSKAEIIKNSFDKPIVYVSVGRSVNIGRRIFVQNIPYDFIVTEGINLVGSNVHYLPKNISNTQDYILASKFVVSKAGWGTIAEAICAEKPIAVIDRNYIEEDRITAQKITDLKMAIKISEEEIYNFEDIIYKLNMFSYNEYNLKFHNESKNIAKKIVDFIRGGFNE